MTRGRASTNTVYKSRSHHHVVQKLEIPSMGNHHVLIARLLVSLTVYHSLTIALPTYSPSDHGLRAYAEVQTTEIQDQVRKAKSIRDVLQILYPRQDPEEILRELMVVEGTIDRFSTSRGRIGQSDEGVLLMTREATQGDLKEMDRQGNENVECGLPVNVTVDAYQELGIEKRLGRSLWPECVTVPRCSPNSGCCPEDHVCTEITDKNALVQKLFLIHENAAPRPHIEVKYITSHTSCHCTPNQRPIVRAPSAVCQPPSAGCPSPKIWDEIRCTCKCAKGCPEPYSQDPYSCECDCLHSIRQCGKVKRGRLDMAPEECKCVESNACERPTCKFGVFSSRKCSCPSFVAAPKMKRPALY
ncbi:vascular endothelial growth factor D-like [Ptychodera flava]|uniref:vascular endothelial growth factor D-like n=1 Tax=Ptychodera flava TaxID=63121 RepID=UPI00396A7821